MSKFSIYGNVILAVIATLVIVYFYPHPQANHYKFEEGRPWNYAKLISGVLRYGMPIDQVLKLVGGLDLDSQSINTWKMGVERALKKYLPNGTQASGQRCPNCGNETLVYQEGCLICTSCGTSKCG